MGEVRSPGEYFIQVLGRFEVRSREKPLVLRPSGQRLIALLVVHGPLAKADAAGLLCWT